MKRPRKDNFQHRTIKAFEDDTSNGLVIIDHQWNQSIRSGMGNVQGAASQYVLEHVGVPLDWVQDPDKTISPLDLAMYGVQGAPGPRSSRNNMNDHNLGSRSTGNEGTGGSAGARFGFDPPFRTQGRRCCNESRSCVSRKCANPFEKMDTERAWQYSSWVLKFGFPLMGWFFFVALGKFAAGFGSAFLLFFLLSRIDLSKPPTHSPPSHAPDGEDAEEYRCPEWLSTRRINFAVAGSGGVGKSTMINTLRGLKARDPLAAEVGVKETTMEPSEYRFPGLGMPWESLTNLDKVSLWDLPGVGTQNFPSNNYIREMGLRYFDGVLIVTAERFTQNDIMLMRDLEKWDVPTYMIRNKADQALEMEYLEYGRKAEDVLLDMRNYYVNEGVKSMIYMISAAKAEQYRLDMDELLMQIANDLSLHRKLK